MALVAYWNLPHSYLGPDGRVMEFSSAGRATLAMMVWMALWWLSEAIDIAITALLPLAAFPLVGVARMPDAAAPYANPLIFLFMGGFLLSLSMRRWGLDRRIALVTLRLVATSPANMVLGFMIATAALSGLVSNTATAAMMLPIAMSVVRLAPRSPDRSVADVLAEHEPEVDENFAVCLMLGIAYAASIGGLTTIIGTPPNVFLVSFVRDTIAAQYRMEISFASWLVMGVPLAVTFLPLVWLLLTRWLFPVGRQRIEAGRSLVADELRRMGKLHRGEMATLVVFSVTAVLWIFRPLLVRCSWGDGAAAVHPLQNLTDAGIVMTTAIALFVIPIDFRQRTFVMDWRSAQDLPWGVLVLFGGGLSLATACEVNGVAEFLGSLSRYVSGVSTPILVLCVTASVIFLTELTSNTATTATLLPVLAALAPGLGVHPYLLVFPAALAASCAFMLPVATPPNAIVFASGRVRIGQMARAGFWCNLVGIILVTGFTLIFLRPWLGLELP
jgi:sodium-dependent dicarboxylate transporter 2/3/5